MIRPEEVYKIGMFNKPHGIGGELQFTFTDDIFDRVEAEYVVCPHGRDTGALLHRSIPLPLGHHRTDEARRRRHAGTGPAVYQHTRSTFL